MIVVLHGIVEGRRASDLSPPSSKSAIDFVLIVLEVYFIILHTENENSCFMFMHFSAFEDSKKCLDRHPKCKKWALLDGECKKNPDWMMHNCCISCKQGTYHVLLLLHWDHILLLLHQEVLRLCAES